jgi:hypothetical protein
MVERRAGAARRQSENPQQIRRQLPGNRDLWATANTPIARADVWLLKSELPLQQST